MDLYFLKQNRPDRILSGADCCSNLQSVVSDVQKTYEYNEDEIKNLQNKQQDLLHQIEFKDLSTVEGFKLYKKLQEVRIIRRLLKNEQKSIEPIYNLLKQNSGFTKLLPTVQSNCIKENQSISTQHYNPRSQANNYLSIEEFRVIGDVYSEKINKIKQENKFKILKSRAEFYNEKVKNITNEEK